MIQRKQTLFLLGSVVISILMVYLPVFELKPEDIDASNMSSPKQFTISVNAFLLILNGTIGVLNFVSIFLFKNRNLQIRICNLAMLINCVFIGLLFFLSDIMTSTSEQTLHFLYGSYLPLIEVVVIFLAVRFIKQDEELVRSAERLR